MSDERGVAELNTKSKSRKRLLTIVLSVVLTAAFFAINRVTGTDLSGIGAVIGISVALLVFVFVVIFIFNIRLIRRFNAANKEAIGLMARGDYQRAQDLLWGWAESTQGAVGAVARHNLGWTLLRQGKLQQCIDLLTDNDKKFERGLKSIAMHPTSAIDIALTHALLGKLPDAEQWFDTAEERAKGRNTPSYPGMAVFARAVIDCRAGRADAAARMLDERWAECEASLTAENVRPLRVVRAFAHATAGARNAGGAEQALSSLSPAYPDEYRFLGVGWPEMRSFLVSHELARSAEKRATLPATD
jgi:hypothetical protein